MVFWTWLGVVGNPFRNYTEVESNPAGTPNLSGPQELCIVFGAVIGTFSGGGDPGIDVYYWEILDPQGNLLIERSGGAQFQSINYSFHETGIYTIKLRVRRNAAFIYQDQLRVTVKNGPELVILPDYLICGEDPTLITALDPDDPNLSNFIVTWKNQAGQIVSNSNALSVTQEGFYYFTVTSNTGGCEVNGNTYAGPSLDFSLTVSNSSSCKGSEVTLSTDTPLSGDWFLIRPGSTTRENLGGGFQILLEKEDLQTVGTYQAIFSANDPNYPGCKSTRKINFEINETPAIQITTLEKPDNCSFPNGQIQLNNLVGLDSLIVEELGQKWSNLPSGSNQILSNLPPQMYTIIAYTSGCKYVRLYDLETKQPPLNNSSTPTIIPPQVSIQAETCGPTGVNPGILSLDFTQGNVTGEYRILAEGVGLVQHGVITDQSKVNLNVPGGMYFLELKIDGCTYPVEPIDIPKKPQVDFSVPSEISICEVFDLIPDTNQELTFTLTYPDLSTQTLDSGEAFSLTMEGAYEIIAVPQDPNSELCPKTQAFTARLSNSFSFEAELLEEDCFGNQIFHVKLDGVPENEVSIRWFNQDGTIVGRGVQYFSSFTGPHSLVVQPLRSGYCPSVPFDFIIEQPVLSVEVNFVAEKICPDPGFASIEMSTNRDDAIRAIEWIFFDDAGNRRDLPQYSGQRTIQTSEPGNYEAVVYNRIGCEIGRNFTKLEKSTLLAEPALDNQYGVCVKNQQGPAIDPGSFASYRWYLEGNLVSEAPIFMPSEVGNYTLEVVTPDGCSFAGAFSTYDLCFFEYKMPDAMILDDPTRKFDVWINQGITEAELFIINRQGQLIYYQEMVENPETGPAFSWDGYAFGKPAIVGTYAVVLKVSNSAYGFSQKVTQSLLVIQ